MTSDYIVPAKNQKCVLEPASDSPSTVSLSDLLDDFALNTMAQLIHAYAPDKLEDSEQVVEWCEQIAGMSYAMAGTMINKRSELHLKMTHRFQGENENAS